MHAHRVLIFIDNDAEGSRGGFILNRLRDLHRAGAAVSAHSIYDGVADAWVLTITPDHSDYWEPTDWDTFVSAMEETVQALANYHNVRLEHDTTPVEGVMNIIHRDARFIMYGAIFPESDLQRLLAAARAVSWDVYRASREFESLERERRNWNFRGYIPILDFRDYIPIRQAPMAPTRPSDTSDDDLPF